MEVTVNEDCILCGFCVDLCPEIFVLGDEIADVIVEEIHPEHEDCCREAADNCPTEAIDIKD